MPLKIAALCALLLSAVVQAADDGRYRSAG